MVTHSQVRDLARSTSAIALVTAISLGNIGVGEAASAKPTPKLGGITGLESQCGPLDDSQHVEEYDGRLGPSKAFVEREEKSTVRIVWRDFAADAQREGINPGIVNGQAWCTGTLIASNLIMTAGHCFEAVAGETPSKKNALGKDVPLPKEDFVRFMNVEFSYQRPRGGTGVRTPTVYKIKKLVEHGQDRPAFLGTKLDYAIISVHRGADGRFPSAKFPIADMDSRNYAYRTAKMLTIVQHPAGNPKVIDAGPFCRWDPRKHPACAPDWAESADLLKLKSVYLFYNNIDTLGGASGAGIIDEKGKLIGVHTNGGCTNDPAPDAAGANAGVSLHAISRVSNVIP